MVFQKTYLLKMLPKLSKNCQTVLPAGDQVFKEMSLWRMFQIQTIPGIQVNINMY